MSAAEKIFLTPGSTGEVSQLTGAHTRKGQIRTLAKNGTRHWINASGWPVVPLSVVEGEAARAEDAKPWRSNALEGAA